MSHHHQHNPAVTSPDTQAGSVTELPTEALDELGDSGSGHRANWLTINQAAKAAGCHKSKVRRALDAKPTKFPHAEQDVDGKWFIPIDDLLAAGFSLSLDGPHRIDPSNVIELRDGMEHGEVPAAAPDSPGQALEVLSGFRSSMHQLASDLAEATGRAAVAETKLEFVGGQRDEARARVVELEQRLAVAQEPRRRGWFRRRGAGQLAAAAGEEGSDPS